MAVVCAVGQVVKLQMEFNLAEFVHSPSFKIFDQCTQANLVLIADHYEVAILKHAIKAVLYAALVDKGILLQLQNIPQQLCRVVEAVRLKELEVELQCLALKEKELHYINALETMLELELN